MLKNKKDKTPYSVLEILSYRRYVIYKYSGKKIKALFWFIINKYHKRMEMKVR